MADQIYDVDLGFNAALTRDNLVQKLSDSCPEVCLALAKNPIDERLPEEEREVALWHRAQTAAMVHMMLHGAPCQRRYDGGEWEDSEMCTVTPCRAAALSFALFELTEDWRQRARAEFCFLLDLMVTTPLKSVDLAVPAALERAASALIGALDDDKRRLLTRAAEMAEAGDHNGAALVREAAENGELLVKDWRTTLVQARAMAKACRQFALISASFPASELVQGTNHRPLPSEQGQGRPKASLLTALVQHLKQEKFEYRDMRELIASIETGAASKSAGAIKEQLRKRVRTKDCRTIRPYGR